MTEYPFRDGPLETQDDPPTVAVVGRRDSDRSQVCDGVRTVRAAGGAVPESDDPGERSASSLPVLPPPGQDPAVLT